MLPRAAFVPCLLVAVLTAASARAADVKTPADVLPESVLGYVEISQPEKLIDLAVSEQFQQLLLQNDDVQNALNSPQFGQLKQIVQVVEDRLGASWHEILRKAAGAKIAVAFNLQGAVLVVQAKDADTLNKLHGTLREMVEADAKNRGGDSPLKSQDYKGFTGWSFGAQDAHAIAGDMLIFSNSSSGVKDAIDRYLGDDKKSLAQSKLYVTAKASASANDLAWGVANIAPLKLLPPVLKGLSGPSDNPGVEFLAGGILEAFKSANQVAVRVRVENDQVKFITEMPFDAAKIAENRKWYFAADAGQAAAKPLRPKGVIASLSGYRDLSKLWIARDELFNEETVANLSQADTNLGLYFNGDFGTEVLAQVSPRMRFVAARQEFEQGRPLPAIKLPAFALVIEMTEPEKFTDTLLASYQQIVGIINLTAGMQGYSKLVIDFEDRGGVAIQKSRYLVPPNTDLDAAEINFNFSPSCARVGDFFVLASTVDICRDLVDELKKPGASEPTADNVVLEMNLAEVAGVLEQNKEAMISQNMLEEGGSRVDAEKQIALLLQVLRLSREASLRLSFAGDVMALETAVGLPK